MDLQGCKGDFLPEDFDDIKDTDKDKNKEQSNDDNKNEKEDITKDLIGIDIKNINCKDHLSLYISNQTADLEKCKFGLLPNNLNIYLNNHQELFLHKNEYNLVESSNLLLRRGIDNNKRNNPLETMAVIYDRSYNNFITKLVDELTPELFIQLNNGELISIYANQNSIPETEDDFNKFKLFIYKYQLLISKFNLDIKLIENLEFNQIYDMYENNRKQSTKNDDKIKKDDINIKTIYDLQNIFCIL